MRQLIGWSLGIAALTLLAPGCGGSDRTPLAPTNTTNGLSAAPIAELGSTYLSEAGNIAESALALYSITIDPATLTATSTLKQQRAAQATDDLYALPIDGFLSSDSLKILGVTGEADAVRIAYSISHPFAAPTNLDAPATAANRLDLGITGRVLFLLDSMDPSGDTFFDETGTGGGRVIAATDAIADADGYYTPGAMVTGSFAANTFPYKLLVDESRDSRTSQLDGSALSNAGNVLGNFDPTTGWTRAGLGANNDGWTGMGYLHQGQTVSSDVALDKDYLAASGFSFDVAILAKYGDPRGGTTPDEKRANRLPAATADLNQFGYRAPHGSLDVESVAFVGESGGFLPNNISASTLSFHVVDWDAKATETDQLDLAADSTSASKVAIGESGIPTLSVSIPDVFGSATTIATLSPTAHVDDDSAFGGDAAVDTGVEGDALFYSELVTKAAGSGQLEGTFTGLVRAVDVENALAAPLVVSLDGSLNPITNNAPRPISYQAFDVLLDDLNDTPTLSLSTPANVLSGDTTTLSIDAANDLNGETITVEIDWDNDGNFEDTQNIPSPYPTPIVLNSTVTNYNNTSLTPANRTIPVRFTDGILGSPILYSPALTFTLGANRPPQVSGLPALVDPTLESPATFVLGAGTTVITDPESNPIILKVTNNVNATVVTGGATLPVTGLGAFTNPPTSTVDFTLWATDALHSATGAGPSNGTAFAPVVGTINVPCVPAATVVSYAFASGSDGWTQGHVFVPAVPNSDASLGNSRFYRCTAKSGQGALTGGILTTGPGALFGCGLGDGDYGNNVDNSMIGPTFSLVGRTDATLLFDSSKNGRSGTAAHYRVLVSTDNGATWPPSGVIYDTTKSVSTIVNETNVTVSMQQFAGLPNLRLRFQFYDTTTSTYNPGTTFAGWSVDTIRVLGCP